MRVPLVGAYNTRPGAVTLATTTSGVVGIGIVGIMIVGSTTIATQKDRRYVNCYLQASRDELSKTATPAVLKRPGWATNTTPAAGSIGNAIHVWVGQGSGTAVVSAFGATNSTIYNGITSLGAITGKATRITETTISGVANLAISSSDNTGWFYPDGGALTQISDGQFPGNNSINLAGTFAHIGGWAFIMGTDGYIYNSDLNSLTSWTDGNKFATNAYPDKGVGCVRLGEYLVAFGTQSFEVLKNANVPPPGSPLARIQDATKQIGAVSAQAIANVRDVLYFVGSSRQGGVSVYRYKGGEPETISNPSLDAQLLLLGPANITMSSVSFYGNTHLFIRAASITYAYCIEENNWWEVSSMYPLWDRMDGVSLGSTIVNYGISITHTSGKVYVINPAAAVYTDDGYAYVSLIQTGNHDFGTSNRKTFYALDLVADQTVSTSPVSIFWSDDDYQRWNDDPRMVDLLNDRLHVTRLGSARKRAFRFVHNANTPFRIRSIELKLDPLSV